MKFVGKHPRNPSEKRWHAASFFASSSLFLSVFFGFSPAISLADTVNYPKIHKADKAGLPGPHHAKNMALRHYIRTGKADVIYRPGFFVVYPFGHRQPMLTCAPLRACDIALQRGEKVFSVALGDTVDWTIAKSDSGSGSLVRPHILIKPEWSGLETNMIIYTNRRTYNIFLKSDPKKYVLRISFYYPDDWIHHFSTPTARSVSYTPDRTPQPSALKEGAHRVHTEDRLAAPSVASNPNMIQIDPSKVDAGYKIFGDHPAWRPSIVFNDGKFTYIVMPGSADTTFRPAFFIMNRSGSGSLTNYSVANNTLIIPELFDHGMLQWGVGSDRQRVRIDRVRAKDSSRGFFSW